MISANAKASRFCMGYYLVSILLALVALVLLLRGNSAFIWVEFVVLFFLAIEVLLSFFINRSKFFLVKTNVIDFVILLLGISLFIAELITRDIDVLEDIEDIVLGIRYGFQLFRLCVMVRRSVRIVMRKRYDFDAEMAENDTAANKITKVVLGGPSDLDEIRFDQEMEPEEEHKPKTRIGQTAPVV
jgi:hypothetical protein